MSFYTKSKLPPGAGRPESRLISEYVAEKFAGRAHALSFPLGPELSTAPTQMTGSQRLRISRPWRPEADAIVWLDEVILLIEAKVNEYLTGLGKLPIYKALVAQTPELAQWRTWEVRMRLVVPRARPWVNVAADAIGAEIDIYEPPWMVDYYNYRDLYWTPGYRAQRQQILDARQNAGLE